MCFLYIMKFCSMIRKNQIMSFAVKWMQLGNPLVKRNKTYSERQVAHAENRSKKRKI